MGRRVIQVFKEAGRAHRRTGCDTALAAWLKAQGMSRAEMARRVGADKATFNLWVDGKALPPLIMAYRIERETGSAVATETWLGCELGRYLWEHQGLERSES